MVTKTCIAPLERAKILLQIQVSGPPISALAHLPRLCPLRVPDRAVAAPDDPTAQAMRGESTRKYVGTWGTMSTVVGEEGVAGLWKGNGANVLRVMPVYALKFAFNDTFKALVAGDSTAPLSFAQLMASGTMAVRDRFRISSLTGSITSRFHPPHRACSSSW